MVVCGMSSVLPCLCDRSTWLSRRTEVTVHQSTSRVYREDGQLRTQVDNGFGPKQRVLARLAIIGTCHEPQRSYNVGIASLITPGFFDCTTPGGKSLGLEKQIGTLLEQLQTRFLKTALH